MNARSMVITVGLLALGAAMVVGFWPGSESAAADKAPAAGARQVAAIPAKEMRLVGPYTHKNLTIFLVVGEDKIKDKEFITLQEAMEQKKIIVHETGNVNQLIVENNSNVAIYIHSGEIVRGGKQDRMLPHDIILPPRCGKVEISSYCVEQGRWRQRGGEQVAAFSGSTNAVSGKELKLAAKLSGDQGKVWTEVSNAQRKLSENAGVNVQALASSSSMELTLSDKKVQDAAEEYVKELSKALEGRKDVIGFAFAINGGVNSADVYACNSLFLKLWPKLLKSAAVEAVAEYQRGKDFKAVAAEDILKFVAEADAGEKKLQDVAKDNRMEVRDAKGAARFKSVTAGAAADFDEAHTSYIKK